MDNFYNKEKTNLHFNPATVSEGETGSDFDFTKAGVSENVEFSDELFPENTKTSGINSTHTKPHLNRF